MTAQCVEVVFHDAERNVDMPATILLPDDRGSQPQVFVSAQLVSELFKLLNLIELETEDEEIALLCRERFGIAVEHGLVLEFPVPSSDEVH